MNIVFYVFVSTNRLQTSKQNDAVHELDYETSIGEWKRRDIQYCRFPGYDLTYAHYTKFPSWGLQALVLSQTNQIPFIRLHPFSVSSDPCFDRDDLFISKTSTPWNGQPIAFDSNQSPYPVYQTIRIDFHRLFIDGKTKEMLTVAINSAWLCLYFVLRAVQLMRYYVIQCSPLVLFSWWRNKISWNSAYLQLC